jgi:protein-S-isoprenylcysteine O-methyltransferase Ste14
MTFSFIEDTYITQDPSRTVSPEALFAGILLLYLLAFFSINAHNVFRGLRARKGVRAYAELERPKGLFMNLAVLGTLVFFAEALLFVCLGLTGLGPYLCIRPLQLSFVRESYVRAAGIVVMGVGFTVFAWSVVARGRYSVSWEMPEGQRLVTWGPYRFIRHPSYLGYFLMFVGLVLTWLNLVSLIPLMAIPGYVKVTATEEEMLTQRFGDVYRKYQETTGRFLPRWTERNGS